MTRARELGKLANRNTLTADNTNNFVGIGSTQPDARLDVDGTVWLELPSHWVEQVVSLVLHLSMVMDQTLMVSQVLDLELP